MNKTDDLLPRSRMTPATHQRDRLKLERIPIKVDQTQPQLRKPEWIRSKLGDLEQVSRMRGILRNQGLHSVCEEAACPNLGECFSQRTATFMILGDICTRRCPFCDVAHGRPQPPDAEEPRRLAEAISLLGLHHVVITSVDRDDLRDGGATHFADCIQAIRDLPQPPRIEILTPDFRGRKEIAIEILSQTPPDVFNHNLETVQRLYRAVRPGADYFHSLKLLEEFKSRNPTLPTKSGVMLGLGETMEELLELMQDLRQHGCEMLTIGQYLQPSRAHLPVLRYVHPDEFALIKIQALELGFSSVASAPMVRSSYHAEEQADTFSQMVEASDPSAEKLL